MKARVHKYGPITLMTTILMMTTMNTVNGDEKKVPERSEIEKKYTWATETIFPDINAWEKAFAQVDGDIPKFEAFKGKLGEKPETLLKFLQFQDEVGPRFEDVFVYASLRADEDTRVAQFQALEERLRGLGVKYGQATAWVDPELASIGWEKLDKWMKADKNLEVYRQHLDDLYRQKKYILSEREEQLIALGGQVAAVPATAYSQLANADLKFPSIKDAQGNMVELSDSAFYLFLRDNDRRVRKDAYNGITGTYAQFRSTAAALLNGNVQTHIFNVRARGYDSCLQAALNGTNIPVGVYDNLVKTVNDNLPLLHRYTAIRRKALDLKDGVHDYDLYTPLTTAARLNYTYEEGVDLMLKALAPLGKEYCDTVKKGVASRWIDVYTTKGKRSGAYSGGAYKTQPFILLNYFDGYDDVSTLAHEMGHSMHSYLTRQNQPYVYGDYATFCAEVASTTNEILLQEYVLKQITDPKVKLFLLSEFLENFRGTVFRQTMFSEFEQRIHEMAEAGVPLTADSMGAAYGEIMKKYYGPDYTHDDMVDNYWIRIPHFYYNFYVFKYATSHCAAANITKRILEGQPGAVEGYMSFLKGGSSKYPIDLLKVAGVAMTSPQPIQDAMRMFEKMLDEMEALLKQVE
jgi:oligoendopeptidase F